MRFPENAAVGRTLRRKLHNHRYQYLFLAPCLVWFAVFSYAPMVGLLLAFKEFKFNMGILQSPWVGLRYFRTFFSYFLAGQLIGNTFLVGFIKIVLCFPLSIILALMLNEVRSRRLKRFTQTVSYLPHFISWVVVAALAFKLLAPNDGIVNLLAARLGGKGDTFFLMEERYFYGIMFATRIWKGTGWGSIVYLAAIAGIDPALYEAATIDGANWRQKMVHITLAGILPTIGIIFILDLGAILSTGYEQNFLLRTPGNSARADILDTYVMQVGLMQGQYGYASAVGLMQSVVGLALVVTANWVSKKATEIGVW